MMMADDLRQEELRMEVRVREVCNLPLGIGVRVRPASEGERVIALAQHLA